MIDIRLLRYSNAGPFAPPDDPPGPWTSYNFGNDPVNNGFTELADLLAVVTLVTSGNPSLRRVEIAPNGGNKVFVTTDSPNLDPAVGATGEIQVAVTVAGEDAGFEIRYLDSVCNFAIGTDWVELNSPPITPLFVEGLDNTGQTTFRLTIDSIANSREANLYRNGILLLGPMNLQANPRPSQTFMWWGEGGS